MDEDGDVSPSTSVEALVLLLRFLEIAADPAQIRHQYAVAKFGSSEILRCAKDLKLRARALTTDWGRLSKTPLPALAECRDGEFVVLARISDEKALIQDPQVGPPQLISRAEFEAVWGGRLVLMTRRATLADLARQFDITWFLRRSTNIAGCWPRCWSPRSSCRYSRWSRRCSSRW